MDLNVFKMLVVLAVAAVMLLVLVGTWLFRWATGTYVPPFENGIAKLDKLFKQLESASEESAQNLESKVLDTAYIMSEQYLFGDWLITDDEQVSFVTNFSQATILASHRDKLAAGMMLLVWSQMMQEQTPGSGRCFLDGASLKQSERFDLVKQTVESAARTHLEQQIESEAIPPTQAPSSEQLPFVKTPQERYDSFVEDAISCVSRWRVCRSGSPELANELEAWIEAHKSTLGCVDAELV